MTTDFTKEATYDKAPGNCRDADMISSLAACADAVLIPMAIAGRNDCFSMLMDRHLTAVKRRLRFMVSNEADLEDVVQETQLKVWLHLKTFRSESNLRTWIIRIAINEACQLHRSGKHKRQCVPLDEAIALPEESAEQRLLRAEAAAALRRVVARLPRKYQEVLRLRDLCELGIAETAKRLQESIPAIKTRLFRARLLLSTKGRKSGILGLAAFGREQHTVRYDAAAPVLRPVRPGSTRGIRKRGGHLENESHHDDPKKCS